ncbi:MAG TPA: D-alanyl-D-alanine carboxypeptidase family protein [Blastocatellia bacterium]|nr:D-alanyl-D-alanine carboxypeptidase family protein [Blastocatellia bacterium]
MKSHRFSITSVIAILIVGLIVVAVRSEGAGKRVQAQAERKPSTEAAQASSAITLSAPVKVAPKATSSASTFSAFAAAVTRNTELQNNLGWAFGGKSQRGWALYTPLIANLVGCDSDVAGELAMRVSAWQQMNGVDATGVLDGDTWSRMVTTFQSQRMKGQPPASEDRLVTIPVSDCYDPSRPEELRKADRESFAAYKRMVAAAAADQSLGLSLTPDGQLALGEKYFKIVSAFRSREYQDQLRRQSPNSGRAGLAVNSPHNTGRAFDLYVGGEPVSTKDENRALQTRTAAYRWLVKNAARFGFRPYFYEPWHWEYAGVGNDAETRRRGEWATR